MTGCEFSMHGKKDACQTRECLRDTLSSPSASLRAGSLRQKRMPPDDKLRFHYRWRGFKEASQTRDYCVAKNATLRAARPDSSLRKERLFGMTIDYLRPKRRMR